MARRGRKYIEIRKKRPTDSLSLDKAIESVKKLSYSKFTGSVELHLAVNIPKDREAKSIKGAVALPHSTSSKEVKIAVFTAAENQKKAQEAGADFVDMEQLIKDVKAGKIQFDVAIASPDVMPKIAVLGKELGPKGLMPNPKTGTVTEDVATAVTEYKKGKVNFSCDESGVIHFGVGKIDMDGEQLKENIAVAISAASDAVGKRVDQLIRTAHLAPTMGPSVQFTYEEA